MFETEPGLPIYTLSDDRLHRCTMENACCILPIY